MGDLKRLDKLKGLGDQTEAGLSRQDDTRDQEAQDAGASPADPSFLVSSSRVNAGDAGAARAERQARSRLNAALRRSQLVLFWEDLWPRMMAPLTLAALFLAVTWIGVWSFAPLWLRVLGVAAFALTFVWFLSDFRRAAWPDRRAAMRRVERVSGHSHRPLVAIDDKLASNEDNPLSQALWRAHQERALGALERLRHDLPHPRAFRKDPYALRVFAALLLFVGFGVAGEERWSRVAGLFDAPSNQVTTGRRLDAWIAPPTYTRRPPVFLTGDSAGLRDMSLPLTAPEGSELVVRAQGYGALEASVELAGVLEASGKAGFSDGRDGASDDGTPNEVMELRIVLNEDQTVSVRDEGELVSQWSFAVEEDRSPEIRLLDDPQAQVSGVLRLHYLIKDDYGVTSAEAQITPLTQGGPDDERGVKRPLVAAPNISLSLPSGERRVGEGETLSDLTSHPWAGSKVSLRLSAQDQAGQTGFSQPHEFVLPQRNFTDPLARAIVEQRRNLALDANAQMSVLDAFDALLIAPEKFIDDARHYLGMRFAYQRLAHARSDQELIELLDLMWELALTIEDGDLSVAERALRQAQNELRQALENNASEEEISRLTEQVRQALNDYMQALAEQMKNNPQAMRQMDPNARSLSSRELEEMLNRIEDLARSGSVQAARDLLAEMQQMLENLQAGRPQQPSAQGREMMQALNDLAQMIQRQQELMDETHQLDQRSLNHRGGEEQEYSSEKRREELAQALEELKEEQGALERRLQDLQERLRKNGVTENGSLAHAGDAMGDAGQNLGEGDADEALTRQGDALEALREGAQALNQQMQQQQGQGGGSGVARGRRNPAGEDPLGRPRRTDGPQYGERVKVPDEIDVQRAREILDELRRRFSNPARPKPELDYLERLLRRY